MSEIVFLQIGQCGNQIGWKFWEKALQEHVRYHTSSSYDLSYRSFFEVGENGSFSTLDKVRARAVLIDTELNVAKKLERSSIGSIFQGCSVAFDATGAGNNWAAGYHERGPELGPTVLEKIRKLAERTDHLDSFFILNSLGGGTGSGFGSFLLEHLSDDYAKLWKMSAVIAPSAEDDCGVVTSPYNTLMSTASLCQFSDCVFPIENASLRNYVHGVEQETEEAFDQMNTVVANFLLDLTAGSRFSGKMNVDLREIETNMVPFPNHKFLCSGISPIVAESAPRNVTGFFTEAMSRKATLCAVDAHAGTYLANGLLVRGDVELNTVRSTIDKLSARLKYPLWNQDGWKIGLCGNAPLYSKLSVLCLTNTSAISTVLDQMVRRFNQLYKVRAYLAAYTNCGATATELEEARDLVEFLIQEYESMQAEQTLPPRPRIIA
jgi:tubulin epsilon